MKTFVVWSTVLQACSSALPEPPRTVHPARAYVEVPYPPPAALVEVVPEPPEGGIWVDGHWVWRGRYYVWQRGGWLRPPEDAAYATWQSVLAQDGRLLFAPGVWYDPNKRPLMPPEVLVVARTPPNQTTVETEAAR
jgi:hypothetical protein